MLPGSDQYNIEDEIVSEFIGEYEFRIFVSVDLIGSTEYKQREYFQGIEWTSAFLDFYDRAPKLLRDCYDSIQAFPIEAGITERLTPIKYIGDEILFSARLDFHGQILDHVQALRKFSYNMNESEAKAKLPCKITIWGASFPVLNRKIPVVIASNTIDDYIGRSIDIGFRLTSFSTRRKMAISLGIAVLVSQAEESRKASH